MAQPEEVTEAIRTSLTSDMFRRRYSSVFEGDERWQAIGTATGDTFSWDPTSTYVLRPTFLQGLSMTPDPVTDVAGAHVLAKLGDSVTTDHISPAGNIKPTTPAGTYLLDHDVRQVDFNSYGTRRGNHEVMVRGTFANIRLRNQLAPGTEGGITVHLPDGRQTSIFGPPSSTRPTGYPWSCWPARSTGRGPRATGRPRARDSSGCAPSSPSPTSASTGRT